MGTVAHALRRIDKLEADSRRVERSLNRCVPGSRLAQELARQLAELDEQLTHWRAFVARAQAAGAKVWSREDFTRGDFVQYRGILFEVLRVNDRSLTIPHAPPMGRPVVRASDGPEGPGPTWTVGYHDGISGRLSAQEMAAREGDEDTGASDLL